MFYVGYPISWEGRPNNIKKGQDYTHSTSTRLGSESLADPPNHVRFC